jgi:uncharacterized protein (DUF427 family)
VENHNKPDTSQAVSVLLNEARSMAGGNVSSGSPENWFCSCASLLFSDPHHLTEQRRWRMGVTKSENVGDYPRPPAIEIFNSSVLVRFNGELVAQAETGFRILETYHPPTFYLPVDAFSRAALRPSQGRQTMCEWKGQASYLDVVAGGCVAERSAWTYRAPAPQYAQLRDHIALYAEPMDEVLVDGVPVIPQPGNFYGGWVTPNISGPIKGAPGTIHW